MYVPALKVLSRNSALWRLLLSTRGWLTPCRCLQGRPPSSTSSTSSPPRPFRQCRASLRAAGGRSLTGWRCALANGLVYVLGSCAYARVPQVSGGISGLWLAALPALRYASSFAFGARERPEARERPVASVEHFAAADSWEVQDVGDVGESGACGISVAFLLASSE